MDAQQLVSVLRDLREGFQQLRDDAGECLMVANSWREDVDHRNLPVITPLEYHANWSIQCAPESERDGQLHELIDRAGQAIASDLLLVTDTVRSITHPRRRWIAYVFSDWPLGFERDSPIERDDFIRHCALSLEILIRRAAWKANQPLDGVDGDPTGQPWIQPLFDQEGCLLNLARNCRNLLLGLLAKDPARPPLDSCLNPWVSDRGNDKSDALMRINGEFVIVEWCPRERLRADALDLLTAQSATHHLVSRDMIDKLIADSPPRDPWGEVCGVGSADTAIMFACLLMRWLYTRHPFTPVKCGEKRYDRVSYPIQTHGPFSTGMRTIIGNTLWPAPECCRTGDPWPLTDADREFFRGDLWRLLGRTTPQSDDEGARWITELCNDLSLGIRREFARLRGSDTVVFEGNASHATPRPPRLTVDLEKMTITLDGTTYDEISSVQTLRWIKVLAARAEVWISASDLDSYDQLLLNARTDRLIKYLPQPVAALIDTDRRLGSRIRLT